MNQKNLKSNDDNCKLSSLFQSLISVTPLKLKGNLTIPSEAKSVIIFVHGSGSDRFSARNAYISKFLNKHGFATLLIDLLTDKEKEDDKSSLHHRFNIELLTDRLIMITRWVKLNANNLSIGYFSSSTGSAAALTSSITENEVKAIVCRSGRTDLVDLSILNKVTASTLLVSGSIDDLVVSINARTFKQLKSAKTKNLAVIPGANHYFEEEGKIDEISNLSLNWYRFCLTRESNQFSHNYNVKSSIFSILNKRPFLNLKFKDRESAGLILSNMVKRHIPKNKDSILILGILHGGAIVAKSIKESLSLPNFDVVLSKRIRDPYNSEKTIGAIFQDEQIFLHSQARKYSDKYLEMEIERLIRDMRSKVTEFGINGRVYPIKGKTVILVDDGSFTGSTIINTCNWVKLFNPSKLIVATPVISKNAQIQICKTTDLLEFIKCPRNFTSVEDYYENFEPVTTDTIKNILNM